MDKANVNAYRRQLDSAKGILQAALYRLQRVDDPADVYQGKNTPPESSDIVRVQTLAENDLRKAIKSEPAKEIDIQDAFEVLLIGANISYTREGESIAYSSKFHVPDFSFAKLDLALDVKLCHRNEREKEIIAELNDDILAYQSKFGNLLFIVYDARGYIRDVDRFKRSFERHKNVIVRVVKH